MAHGFHLYSVGSCFPRLDIGAHSLKFVTLAPLYSSNCPRSHREQPLYPSMRLIRPSQSSGDMSKPPCCPCCRRSFDEGSWCPPRGRKSEVGTHMPNLRVLRLSDNFFTGGFGISEVGTHLQTCTFGGGHAKRDGTAQQGSTIPRQCAWSRPAALASHVNMHATEAYQP